MKEEGLEKQLKVNKRVNYNINVLMCIFQKKEKNGCRGRGVSGVVSSIIKDLTERWKEILSKSNLLKTKNKRQSKKLEKNMSLKENLQTKKHSVIKK